MERRLPDSISRPARLRQGSTVALISPAGPIAPERLDSAMQICSELGLVPRAGRFALARDRFLAGADQERAADLQAAIDSPEIDAIWALRGGYGTMRLLEHIRLATLRIRPIPFIGFSDNTAIHLMLAAHGIASFHAPHAGGDWPPVAIRSFRDLLFNAASSVIDPSSGTDVWVSGSAEGPLIGGNLSLIAALEGTRFAIRSEGALLFIEEIGEPAYRVDRLMMQLRLSGALSGVAGVVVGQFTDCSDDTANVYDVVRDHVERLGVPVLANASFGHIADNITIPMSLRARLDADAHSLTLLDAAVV